MRQCPLPSHANLGYKEQPVQHASQLLSSLGNMMRRDTRGRLSRPIAASKLRPDGGGRFGSGGQPRTGRLLSTEPRPQPYRFGGKRTGLSRRTPSYGLADEMAPGNRQKIIIGRNFSTLAGGCMKCGFAAVLQVGARGYQDVRAGLGIPTRRESADCEGTEFAA